MGWRRQYGEFAGPRYPRLIAYAQLLTGDRNRADALVAFALRRTFSALRRLGTDEQVEAEIRRLIVARFLATAGSEDAAHGNAAVAADPVCDAAEPSEPMEQPEVDLALYAPPNAATQQTFSFLHAPVTDETDEASEDSHEEQEPHQSQPRAEVEKSQGAESESDHTHAALGMLAPQARAMTVLRHYDRLAPGLIAVQLGLDHDLVVKELHASYSLLRSELGITIPDEPDYVTASGGGYEVIVSPHARSR